MIVADTNLTVCLLLDGPLTAVARQLYESDDRWIVPSIWPHEMLNVLTTYAKAGGVTLQRSLTLWRQAMELMQGHIIEVDWEQTLALGVKHKLSAYDAQYICLALQQRTICVTEDRRLRKAMPGVAISIEDALGERPARGH